MYCLQEVSQKGLKETFIPKLRRRNLECIGFAPSRKSSGPHNRGKFGHNCIGSAIFCSMDKFELITSRRVQLKDFVPFSNCSSNTFIYDVRSKYHSLVMAKLRLRATGQQLVVANTHLFWNPARTDVKVMQTLAATAAVAAFCGSTPTASTDMAKDLTLTDSEFSKKEEDSNENSKNEDTSTSSSSSSSSQSSSSACTAVSSTSSMPTFDTTKPEDAPYIVLCGDFNLPPELPADELNSLGQRPNQKQALNGAFELLTTGTLASNHTHHPNVWNAHTAVNPQMPPLSQPFRFYNVYEDNTAFAPYQPWFSTKTDDFSGWIDHIWCTHNVQVQMVLRPPVWRGHPEAQAKALAFPPMPNRVSILVFFSSLLYGIVSLSHY